MERQVLKITMIDGFSHVEIEGTEADYLNCIYATTHAVLEALFKKQGVKRSRALRMVKKAFRFSVAEWARETKG